MARYKSSGAKPASLHHLWGKQNYQALFVYRSDLGQNVCHFFFIFALFYSYIRPFFFFLQDKFHPFNIQDDRSTCFPSTTNYKNNNNIKRLLWRIIGRDCSVRSICHYVVCRVIMGLEPKLSKKSYLKLISKITLSDHPLLNFAKCQTCSASCRVFEWTVVVWKRSQDNIRLHFTSKTPYSSDTRGILSTPACDVHGRLKRTTSKAIRKIRSISWQTVMTGNIIQRNIQKDVYWEWSVSDYPKSRITPCR